MDIINLGAARRAAPRELGGHCRETRCRIAASFGRPQRSHDVALDGERGREPARDGGRCALAGRKLLVPDRIGNPERPQRRPRPALLACGVDS